MTRATDAAEPSPASFADKVRHALKGKYVCPFCAAVNDDPGKPCHRCALENKPATRQATQLRIGPWYVMQSRNPAAPGMRFNTLLSLVRKKQITPRSIVRGPTTHQLWKFAAQVKGLSREFGLCWHCGSDIASSAAACAYCGKSQEPPMNPDLLLEGKEPTVSRTPERGDAGPSGGESSADIVLPNRVEIPSFTPRDPVMREIPAPSFSATAASSGQDFESQETEPPITESATPASSSPPRAPSTPEPVKEPAEASWPPANPKYKEPVRILGNDILSPREVATAFQVDYKPHSPRRIIRKTLAVFVMLLLISAVAFGAMLYINPPLREKAGEWTQRQYVAARHFVMETFQSAPADPTVAAPAASTPAATGSETSPPPPTMLPPPRRTPVVEPPVAPSPDRAKVPAAPQADPPATQPAPRVPAVAALESGDPVASPPSSAPPSVYATDDLYERVREHWRNALDAEAMQDFPEAIQHYQQIQKLPKSVWPANLELRLQQARKQVR